MRKIGLVALLLAACGDPDRLAIAIAADGYVKLDGEPVTLDELARRLAARREAGPREQFEHAADASALSVMIDPADDAPWAQVGWLMVVLAEQKFWRLSFPGGRDAPLPVDSGVCPISDPPDSAALLLRLLVREDGAYAFGSRTTRDVEEVGAWIDAAPREGIACRIGVIRGQPRAPWRNVRAAFDLLRGRGAGRIEFDAGIPPREARARSPLPPPRSEPLPASWGGASAVAYWSGTGYFERDETFTSEGDLDALVEGHRLRLGLPRLEFDKTLDQAARLHADEMDRMGYFGHFSPVPANRAPGDRLAKQGWPEERRHAELLAKAETAPAAFAALLAKPENARVLADLAFRYAGVARSGDCWVVLLGAED
jgi:uncharacterized protein YkwD